MASGSSSTNQAAKEKQHWRGVARGAEFQKTVDQLGAKKDQSITVRLQRDESHGRSFSLEASFTWAPAVPQADCKQQLGTGAPKSDRRVGSGPAGGAVAGT